MLHCPLCEGKVYSSHGGFYRHLRDIHNISRTGEKLTDTQLRRIQEKEQGTMDDGSKKSDNEEETD